MTAFERTPAPKKDRIEKPIDPHYAEPTSVDPTLLEESGTDITERLHALIDEAKTNEPTVLEDKSALNIQEDLSNHIDLLKNLLISSGNQDLSTEFNSKQVNDALNTLGNAFSAEEFFSNINQALGSYDAIIVAEARSTIEALNQLKKLDEDLSASLVNGVKHKTALEKSINEEIENKKSKFLDTVACSLLTVGTLGGAVIGGVTNTGDLISTAGYAVLGGVAGCVAGFCSIFAICLPMNSFYNISKEKQQQVRDTVSEQMNKTYTEKEEKARDARNVHMEISVKPRLKSFMAPKVQ